MTQARITRLRNKIQASRSRIMSVSPAYALLLMYVRFVAVSDVKKISTNGRCICFSPDYLDRLYGEELDLLLCHQILHVVTGQIWRPRELKGDDYHFACDIAVSHLLPEGIFTKERYGHLGEIRRSIPGRREDVSGFTPDEIYFRLPYSLYAFGDRVRSAYLPDDDLYWDRKNDLGQNGVLILDTPELAGFLRREKPGGGPGSGTGGGSGSAAGGGGEEIGGSSDGDGARLRRFWRSRAEAALKAAAGSAGQYGDDVLLLERAVRPMHQPLVDWKRLLNEFVQESTFDYSFSPPDRRYVETGFFLPDLNEAAFVPREILFMADASGSVDDAELSAAFSEIRGAIEQFGGSLRGKLGFFDADVYPPVGFDSVGDLLRIRPRGGGGTDFRAVFDYIGRRYRNAPPACIVIFTDGDGPYPIERAAMGVPVLWLINNREMTPPWGKTVKLPTRRQNADVL